MSSFVLKIIGIVSMLLDHVGKVFFPDCFWFVYLGRLAFPIFAFGVAQGYLHTKNLKKYFWRLGMFAMVSQIPFLLFRSTRMAFFWDAYNVIFTLFFGLAAILFFDRIHNKFFAGAIVSLVCTAAEVLHLDYGAYGVATVVLFFLLSKVMTRKTSRQKLGQITVLFFVFVVLTILRYLYQLLVAGEMMYVYVNVIIWTVASFFLILLYNGKLGLRCKYLFYVFYPVHLSVIGIVYYLLGIGF